MRDMQQPMQRGHQALVSQVADNPTDRILGDITSPYQHLHVVVPVSLDFHINCK